MQKRRGRKVAVLGVGMHPFGKFPDRSVLDLGTHAIRMALKDANLEWRDIQAIIASGAPIWQGMIGQFPGHFLARSMGYLGVPIINITNACASGITCAATLANMIAVGLCDIGIAVGMDIAPKGFYPIQELPEPAKEDTAFHQFRIGGAPNPAVWAFECVRRMETLGTTHEDLAMAKVTCSRHSISNTNARYRKVFTKEEVLNSPMVSYPLRLYELCATSDGAAAVILGTMEQARKRTTKPITIAAAAVGSPVYEDPTVRLCEIAGPVKNGPIVSESVQGVKMAYEQAGMGPEDIDLFEIPDNSSWHYMVYTDVVLQAEPGTAEKLLRAGDTAVGGKRPINPSGGFASFGETFPAQGEAQIYEMTQQLRGQAGARQVVGAKACLSTVYGGAGTNAAIILKK